MQGLKLLAGWLSKAPDGAQLPFWLLQAEQLPEDYPKSIYIRCRGWLAA